MFRVSNLLNSNSSSHSQASTLFIQYCTIVCYTTIESTWFPNEQCNMCRIESMKWWMFSCGCFIITNIIIIITHNMNKQINSQLIDPGNEQWWRKGAVNHNTLGISWVIVQFLPKRTVLCYITIYNCTVLTLVETLTLTLSSIMTRSLGSVRSIFRTLCLVCAWLLPTKKYLWKGKIKLWQHCRL